MVGQKILGRITILETLVYKTFLDVARSNLNLIVKKRKIRMIINFLLLTH